MKFVIFALSLGAGIVLGYGLDDQEFKSWQGLFP